MAIRQLALPAVTLALTVLLATGGACAKADRHRAATGEPTPDPVPATARAPAAAAPPVAVRKLIHRRELRVRVADLASARRAAESATRDAGGFVARSEARGEDDDRTVELVLRIPPARLDGVQDRLARLGTVLGERARTEDVTEAHADLSARLGNARRTEARLLELQARSTASLTDVLAAEREVHRVREGVEQLEAQLKAMDGLVDLATVTLTLVPRPAAAPPPTSFGGTISATFHGSVEALLGLGRGAVLLVVALAPWLLVLAPVGLGALLWSRRRTRPEPG